MKQALEIPQRVLNALALTFVPMSKWEMGNYLHSISESYSSNAMADLLVRNGTVIPYPEPHSYTVRYSMPLQTRMKIICAFVDVSENKRETMLNDVRGQSKYDNSRYYHYDYESKLRTQLCRALAFHSEKDSCLYVPESSGTRTEYGYDHTDDPMLETMYAIISSPEYSVQFARLIANMPLEVISDLADDVIADMKKGVWTYDYDRICEVIAEDKALSEGEKSALFELFSWPMNVFRDDFKTIRFNTVTVNSIFGLTTLGVKAIEEKDGKLAEKYFRVALKKNSSQIFDNDFINLMLVCALKMSGSAMALKTLDSYVRKDIFKLKSGSVATKIFMDSISSNVDDSRWDTVNNFSKSLAFIGNAVSWMVADAMGAPDSRIKALSSWKLNNPINEKFAIFNRKDLIPYIKTERWEKAMNNLMVKLGYSNSSASASTKTPSEAMSKIVYLIGDHGKYIQPVLKKSKDGINWTKGRNIAIKTFADGIPEMNEGDRAIAAHTTVSVSYWGSGKLYELGGPAVMALLAGHQDIYRYDNPEIKVNVMEEAPYLLAEKTKGGVKFKSNFSVDDTSSNVQVNKETDILYKVITVTNRQKEIIRNLVGVTFPADAQEQLKTLLGCLGRDIVVHSDADDIESACETVKTSSVLTLVLQPEGDGLKVNVYVKPFVCDAPYFAPGEGARNVMASINGKPLRTVRNFREEREGLEVFMSAAGDILGEERDDASYHIDGPQNCLQFVETIRSMGDAIRAEWPEGCRYKIKGVCELKDLSVKVKSGINWFELTGELKISEDRLISMATLLSLMSSSQGRYLKIGEDEFIALSDKLRSQVASLSAVAREEKKGKVGLASVAAPVLDELKKAGADVSLDRSAAKLLKSIEYANDVTFDVPCGLEAELRPYQEEGFRWLCRLASWGAGACLADDMGLGKTIQTLALLLQRGQEGPALVVAPASVAANWTREIVRFAPALQVLALNEMSDEARKQAISEAGAYDVVLTTYGVLLSQIEDIAVCQWATAVLDEAHVIKNRETKSSSACMRVKAGFRMILTGTPLQNNVGELWNLFQFINPGYLGSFQHFNEAFLVPIQERGDKDRQSQLKKIVLPFMLRRTKSDVLDELPPKTEQYIYVDMDDAQTAVYESIRRNAELSMEEHQLNLVQTLSEITRLRMTACSASLVNKNCSRRSAKVDELLGLVQGLSSGGHKALVFSQFTSFLEIVRETLDSEGVKYLYLDGSTPLAKRQKLVRDFQTGDVPVFLISLKAGGLGLNLTAADYIIHTDPWWNPAIEDQASDRAYRIGQSRPVTVYHILSRNTIEEKILTMHRDKRSLADALLEGSDISCKLTREEILKLL